MIERIPLYQVDAFTQVPFRGNPAAVCLLPEPLEDELMQAIAAEMNLSETAYLLRIHEQQWSTERTFGLRWFTPKTEVRLCGHATLATAAVLFDVIDVASFTLTFETLSGELVARRTDRGIALDFPLDPPVPMDAPQDVLAALGMTSTDVVAAASGEQTRKLLLHLTDADRLQSLAPDFAALLDAGSMAAYRGLIVTAAGASDSSYDFVSRYFAPWVGIDEDPVTGSAHTLLAPYWARRLGQDQLHAYQASARGGQLWVRLLDEGRVELVGEAAIVFEGYFSLS